MIQLFRTRVRIGPGHTVELVLPESFSDGDEAEIEVTIRTGDHAAKTLVEGFDALAARLPPAGGLPLEAFDRGDLYDR